MSVCGIAGLVTVRSSRSSNLGLVVLEQYRAFGIDGLTLLDGMFAFAIWDEDEERLVLMRDRFGKKPLYWTRTKAGALLFASEPKAFEAHPEIALELDPVLLPEYLT